MLQELVGSRVENFSIEENGVECNLLFHNSYSLCAGTLLRLVGKNGCFVSVHDHKHKFGLPKPYDAETEIRKKITGKEIKKVELDKETGDLFLFFEEVRIEVICSSVGYEAYQLYGPGKRIRIGRGGTNQLSEPVTPLADARSAPQL
jgi:hypothetical protein